MKVEKNIFSKNVYRLEATTDEEKALVKACEGKRAVVMQSPFIDSLLLIIKGESK